MAPVVETTTATDWSGFYGGLSFSGMSGAVTENPLGGVFPDMDSETGAGAFIGYNWQRNALVYGAELNYTSLEMPIVGLPNSVMDDIIEARGRVGYTITDDLLGYGFVGLSTSSFDDNGAPYDLSGMSFGIGAEYMFADTWFGGLEISRRDISGENAAATNTLGFDIDAVSLRIGYKY